MRIQPVAQRRVGLRVEVAGEVQGEAQRGVAGAGGDLLGTSPGRDPQGHGRVPQVVEPQPLQTELPDRRAPDAGAKAITRSAHLGVR